MSLQRVQLSWGQVNAWRLSRHGLSPRLKHGSLIDAVKRACGVQAQVLSAAELALWARVDGLAREEVQSALWQEHTLLKTWVMRGTLHLLAADDLPLYVAARSALDTRNWLAYFDYFGLTAAHYEAFIEAVPQVLSRQPMTREQFTTAVAERLGDPRLGELLRSSSWGSLFKPSAFRGDLCFGPSQGQNVTFVNARQWLGLDEKAWHAIEPEAALREIVRRYLMAYGPSGPQDFALWWWGGGGVGLARKLFREMEDELVEADVEGWRAPALREAVEQMQGLEPRGSVNLLPLFDAYVLGLPRNVEAILPSAHKSWVFRPQGWVTAVVLVDGYMQGVWEHEVRRSQTVVKVSMFSQPSASVKRGIEAEAERLGTFLGSAAIVKYAGD